MSSVTENQVASYIEEHPEVLEQLGLRRDLGAGVSDMQPVLLRKLRGQVDRLRETQQGLIETGRENEVTLSRIHGAALRLCEANSLEMLAGIIADELPLLCGVDVAALAIETRDLALPQLVARLHPGILDHWIGPADTMLQSHSRGKDEVFPRASAPVASIALLRLEAGGNHPPAIIAFGSYDPEWFTPEQSTDLVAFLAGIAARRLAQLMP